MPHIKALESLRALRDARLRPRVLRCELTNRCSMRCAMCGIWTECEESTIHLPSFRWLLRQRATSRLRLISLTGGEPLLLDELPAYYRTARALHRRAHINISSNGYHTARTVRLYERTDRRNTSLTLSYDGLRSHDAIRGVRGAAERLLETARQVRDRFPSVELSLKMVLLEQNHGELLDTARQAMSLGLPFRIKTIERLKCHQNRAPSRIVDPDYSAEAAASITAQARELLALGARTNRRYIKALLAQPPTAPAPCSCSPRTLFAGVDGEVFLCRRMDPIGNLERASLDQIWRSAPRLQRTREMRRFHGSPMSVGFGSD